MIVLYISFLIKVEIYKKKMGVINVFKKIYSKTSWLSFDDWYTCKIRLRRFDGPTFSTPPLPTHTSELPIFNNYFDYENIGKFLRHCKPYL